MKKLFILLFSLCVLFSCKEENKSQSSTDDGGAYAKSAGRPNALTIVVNNHLWEGEVGEALRKKLAASVKGLPQEEPLFTIRQMPPTAFKGFANKSRLFLKINKGNNINFEVYKNKYARPQTGIEIWGNTDDKIIEIFNERNEEIINKFKATEILNKQSRIKNPLQIKGLKEKLGITITVPKVFRVAKATDDFYWIRKKLSNGTMDIIAYEVPMDFFKDSLSVAQNVIRVRDSIGGSNVVVDEGGKFITEEAYAPYLKETTFKDREAYETRGTWEVKNKWMAGPFLNYLIKDLKNNRLLVLEGFVFAPSINKRDYMLELEALLNTVTFVE